MKLPQYRLLKISSSRKGTSIEAEWIDVVTCGECKWWWKEWETCTHKNLVDGHACATTFKADCFCSYGERKERE